MTRKNPSWILYMRAGLKIAAIIILIMIYLGHRLMMGQRYAVSKKEAVNYSGQATFDDAKALGNELKRLRYFDGSASDVLLKKDSGLTIVSFVVNGGWNDDPTVEEYRSIGRAVAEHLLGHPLIVRMLDTHLNTHKEIKID